MWGSCSRPEKATADSRTEFGRRRARYPKTARAGCVGYPMTKDKEGARPGVIGSPVIGELHETEPIPGYAFEATGRWRKSRDRAGIDSANLPALAEVRREQCMDVQRSY